MITIKKYSNRRLYNTSASKYVNLDEIAALIQRGEDVEIVDAKSGDDLTRSVLLQVILEVQGGIDLLPVGLLHRIIRAAGDHPSQRLMLKQLAAGMEMMDVQMASFERQFPWLGPGGKRAETAPESAPDAPPVEPSEAPDEPGELDALRARLAALERRLTDDH